MGHLGSMYLDFLVYTEWFSWCWCCTARSIWTGQVVVPRSSRRQVISFRWSRVLTYNQLVGLGYLGVARWIQPVKLWNFVVIFHDFHPRWTILVEYIWVLGVFILAYFGRHGLGYGMTCLSGDYYGLILKGTQLKDMSGPAVIAQQRSNRPRTQCYASGYSLVSSNIAVENHHFE